MHQQSSLLLVQIMAFHLIGAKLLSEPKLAFCHLDQGTNFSGIIIDIQAFSFMKLHLKMSSAKSRSLCLGLNVFTLNVGGQSYLGLTTAISRLLMPWLLTSPGHQQPCYRLCRIGRCLSYLRKDFNYLHRINVKKWHNMFMLPLKNLAHKGLREVKDS